ncbi:MAG: hypothetical protein V4737_11310, partial [Curtobacterium sp.]
VAGVAGELDRLDRSAPRGRSVAERSLRALLEGARADVLTRRTTTRVRAAQGLLRLAEDGAEIVVERVDDALAPEVEEQVLDVAADTGAAVVVEPVDGVLDDEPAPRPESAAPEQPVETPAEDRDQDRKEKSDKKKPDKKHDKEKSDKKKGDKKKGDKKQAAKKDSKKKDSKKKDGKKK